MGKKKFIKKDEGQHFYLLHRSQTDEAYAKEERPSDFVLVPADVNGNDARKIRFEEEARYNGSVPLKRHQDQITPMGFKNDGYDYTKHLKVMGGGRFIGKDGAVRDLGYDYSTDGQGAAGGIELPEDALPSAGELERNLEAVTISHEYMDEDLKAALFEGEDEEGEFEELQDDFIEQIKSAPEQADFDFDAHIADLMAKSERSVQAYAAPRGWDHDKKLLATGRFGKKSRDDEEELPDIAEGDEYEYDEDGDGDDDEEYEEYEDFDGDHEGGGSHSIDYKGGKRVSAEQESLFEKMLDEYDDDQLGYIEEADEEDLQGVIDFDGDELFESALDEYLQEQKDNVLAEGITVKKGLRSIEQLEDPVSASITREEALKPENVKKLYDGEKMRQLESKIDVEEIEKEDEHHDGLLTCQEYLRDERVEEKWDCETILSTYSTLDNHPTVIKDSNTKYKPYQNKYTKSVDAAQLALSATGSSAGSLAPSVHGSGITQLSRGVEGVLQLTSSGTAAKILLKGKHSLPEGFAPERKGGVAAARNAAAAATNASVSLTANSLSMLALNSRHHHHVAPAAASTTRVVTLPPKEQQQQGARDGGNKIGDDGQKDDVDGVEEDDDEDDSEDEDYEYEEGMTVSTTMSAIRMKGETPEQRKARKAVVKDEKRAKRTIKKQLKNAYKDEDKKQSTAQGRQQSINNASVFKYTV